LPFIVFAISASPKYPLRDETIYPWLKPKDSPYLLILIFKSLAPSSASS